MSDTTSRSSVPLRMNSPESYESAALEIELEKQMVKALKRLSMGNLIEHDPDFPMEDPEVLLMNEKERTDDSTASLDTLSLSKSASPPSSGSHTPPLEAKDPSASANDPSSDHTSHYVTPDDSFDSETSVNHENVLWVPANLHPEVNPQQFKQHVKVTIDELLERKLSRSQSNRSKRSSLSLTTNDDVHKDSDFDSTESDTLSHQIEQNNRYSNPSLLELSTELETLSRLAGMDSDDAVTLARSLSTHSLGYTEVEKAAIDELGAPHTNVGANQAEILDLGMDKSVHRTFSGQPVKSRPTQGPPHRTDLQKAQHRHPDGRSHSTQQLHQVQKAPKVHLNESEGHFALKRSRRLHHRKPHTSTPTHLGSQLQSKKAGSLAELRHNLNSTSMPLSYHGESEARMKSSISRQSMQSINPRSSQILFSYKGPPRLQSYNKVPASAPPNSAPPSPVLHPRSPKSPVVGQMNKDTAMVNPMNSAELRQKSREQRQLTGNQYIQHRHKPTSLSSRSLRENLQQAQNMAPQSGFASMPGPYRPTQRKPSPTSQQGFDGQHKSERRNISPQQVPNSQYMHHGATSMDYRQKSLQQNQAYATMQFRKQRSILSKTLGRSRPILQEANRDENGVPNEPFHSHKASRDVKIDKTSQLNENLDMLRNEINEFKESLSHPDAKTKPKTLPLEPEAESSEEVSPTQSGAVPDFSFDTSLDLSYEDTLGIEKEILDDLKDEGFTSTPHTSPVKRSHKAGGTQKQVDVETTKLTSDLAALRVDDDKRRLETRLPEQIKAPYVSEKQGDLEREQRLGSDTDEVVVEDSFPIQDERKTPSQLVCDKIDVMPEKKESIHQGGSGRDDDMSPTETAAIPVPLEATSTGDSKQLRNKKSFDSLSIGDKKKNKKGWLWSKGRSVSAQHVPQDGASQKPSRSVSSPDIQTNKRDHKEIQKEPKENVISKLFKKKRSNSVGSTHLFALKNEAGTSEERESKSIKRFSSAIFKTSKDDDAKSISSREEQEAVNEEKQERHKEGPEEQSTKEKIKNKFRSRDKHSDERPAEKTAIETVEVEETIEEVSEDAEEEESKPQTTLEVQEKIKKLIKRTSKANPPLEYTDSAFGFPLPPPSVSTLIMLDYRFPVHVERAIYRLSHLKLANRKRSLREQVLLSNFMYAYLNLVDHTLHLEQRMSAEESDMMEEPEADMGLFNDDDKDTDFESEDDALEDNAFDVRLDLGGEQYNEITV